MLRHLCEFIDPDNEQDMQLINNYMQMLVDCMKKDRILPIDPDGKSPEDRERVDDMLHALVTGHNLLMKRKWLWYGLIFLSPSFK